MTRIPSTSQVRILYRRLHWKPRARQGMGRKITIKYIIIISIIAANVFAPFGRRFTHKKLVFRHYDRPYKYKQCDRKDPS